MTSPRRNTNPHRPRRLLLAVTLLMSSSVVSTHVAMAADTSSIGGHVDPKQLDELTSDVKRFTDMVSEYRGTAREVLKRAFKEKMKAVGLKYDAQIDANEHDAKDRRNDAIAMFEAFLQKYPNDKRWTPDAMFRLAELYYEKSAEDYLDADEAYKKAIEG
ncbi:MAG TPA: hypothetical protein VK989_02420, partial [Polyangia bacterium]|nr:hypothetical protein [Polyangia bacterium]